MSRRQFLRAVAVGSASAVVSDLGAKKFDVFDSENSGAMPLLNVRDKYSLTKDRTYFNTGGLGPAPIAVQKVVVDAIKKSQTVSEHGHRNIESVRIKASKFIDCHPSEVAFMRNATEGNSTIAAGMNLHAGDEIIIDSHAHPGGSIPWLTRQKFDGIKVRTFEPDSEASEGNVNRIRDIITDRTKVIQVSQITAPTGIKMPIPKIGNLAREHGIWFHVDGAQSLGQIPVDVYKMGCDSCAFSGHKWLGATHGTGILYVAANRLESIKPSDVGSYSSEDYDLPDKLNLVSTARRFECGTRDVASILGVGAAIDFMNEFGIDSVCKRSFSLAKFLREQLAGMPGVELISPNLDSMASAMTTFRITDCDYKDVYRHLLNVHKLRCRIVSERGLDSIRVSTHIFNSKSECENLIGAVRDAQKKL